MTVPFYTDDAVMLWHGDCLDVMREMPDNSVDAVVTDPPYGLEFMGKEWDSFAPARTQYHGERADTTTNISDDRTKPSSRHRVSYAMTRPTFRRCIDCGRREFFGTPCICAEPIWSYEQPTGTPTRMAAYQTWCQAWATEALRVLKPGGHMLAFGGTRTWHRLTCAVEDAGFEIRDSIAWLYGSGFPKSLDVSKAIDKTAGAEREITGAHPWAHVRASGAERSEGSSYGDGKTRGPLTVTAPATDAARQWQGWGTALKPSHEPVVIARKPLTGTVAANVQQWGTGALNIDACRIGQSRIRCGASPVGFGEGREGYELGTGREYREGGRWPANVILDDTTATELDKQSGNLTSGVLAAHHNRAPKEAGILGAYGSAEGERGFGDSGGASRFFYTPKADSQERPRLDGRGHPTVKPLDLMRWLVRLVTPPGGTVLDPFLGSGTTAEACIIEHFHCIGIERDDTYIRLAKTRLAKPIEPVLGGM